MTVQNLKISPEFFEAVQSGLKNLLRKDDRKFQVGDCLVLLEFDGAEFTGRDCMRTVKYILNASKFIGVTAPSGHLWVILGLDP